MALVGCGDNLAPGLPLPPVPVLDNAHFPAEPNRELDLLVVIENSPNTAEYQFDFGTAAPAFLDVLGQLDAMPSLHFGVVTSDMGTQASQGASAPSIGTAGNGGCLDNGGKDGLMQLGVLEGLHDSAMFLTDTDGVLNTDLSLAGAIDQMVKVGSGGCGFAQHFSAMRRALTNPANGAFLRADANLAIVILADEDDCSVRDPAMFDPADTTLGTISRFRCTRFGLMCDQDLDTVGTKTNCRSDPNSRYVDDVGTYVEFVTGLKADRRQIMGAAIVGNPSPVAVGLLPPAGGPGSNRPTLLHSCMYMPTPDPGNPSGLTVADPGVRDMEFAVALGGPVESICTTDLRPGLANLGHAVKQLVGDPCLTGDTSGTCTVTDEYADGTTIDVPACPADGDCYTFDADPKACPDTADHRRVRIRRLVPPPLGTFVSVRCVSRP